ncbi:MAG: hypothetical protein WBM83_00155 [Flavobacteriaceae bacterium]
MKVSYDSLSQITGNYKNEETGKVQELFERDGLLWLQNEVFGERFEYVGENRFEYPGMTNDTHITLQFDLKQKDAAMFVLTTAWVVGNDTVESFTKV